MEPGDPSAESDVGPGTQIDRYEVVRCVATGGMGRVWLGRLSGKHGFEKPVAIKMLRPDLASDPKVRAMLLDEARICSRIQHASVAQILDVGEHGAHPYVVFEWVEGAPLRDLFAAAETGGGRVPVGPLLRVMAAICEGLHAAHELTDADGRSLQVVHRDVTPGNVMVGRGGFAKLIDFGVARARDRVAGETRSGIVKGTPQYMAPEQAQGVRVDRRADVWAVGAVLHRGLAGSAPLRHQFEMEAFIRGGVFPRPLPDSVPAEVRDVVARAMHRDPAARFQTAAELGAALDQALRGIPGPAPIRALFPEVTPLPATLAEAATLPTSPAAPAGYAPPPPGRSAPASAAPGPSRVLKVTYVGAIVAAVVAVAALVWALVSP